MRSLSTYFWFRRNLLVLQRTAGMSERSGAFSERDLVSCEADAVPWIRQPARIHVFAFEEPVPEAR
jgi:hypothetical protein